MSIGFRAAIRINTDPNDVTVGVLKTLVLFHDSVLNRGILPVMKNANWAHTKITNIDFVQMQSAITTLKAATRGKGVGFRWDGNVEIYPERSSRATGEITDADMHYLMDSIGHGSSSFAGDGFSRYLWFCPNFGMHAISGKGPEQWIQVMPEGVPTYGPGTELHTTVLKIALVTDRAYQAMTPVYKRWGYIYAGPGTITTTGTTSVTGSGTTFKTDFTEGDRIYPNTTGDENVITAIADDTHLTTAAVNPSTAVAPYIVKQVSTPSISFPIYSITPF